MEDVNKVYGSRTFIAVSKESKKFSEEMLSLRQKRKMI